MINPLYQSQPKAEVLKDIEQPAECDCFCWIFEQCWSYYGCSF